MNDATLKACKSTRRITAEAPLENILSYISIELPIENWINSPKQESLNTSEPKFSRPQTARFFAQPKPQVIIPKQRIEPSSMSGFLNKHLKPKEDKLEEVLKKLRKNKKNKAASNNVSVKASVYFNPIHSTSNLMEVDTKKLNDSKSSGIDNTRFLWKKVADQELIYRENQSDYLKSREKHQRVKKTCKMEYKVKTNRIDFLSPIVMVNRKGFKKMPIIRSSNLKSLCAEEIGKRINTEIASPLSIRSITKFLI